jgi:hypothetical protein
MYCTAQSENLLLLQKYTILQIRFQAFMSLLTTVVVLSEVTSCGHRRFGRTSAIKMEVAVSSVTLVELYESTHCRDSEHCNLNNGDITIYIQVQQIFVQTSETLRLHPTNLMYIDPVFKQ